VGDEGSTRIQSDFTADRDLIRSLDVGQACYIRRRSAVYVQVARPRPSPLSLPAACGPGGAGSVPAPGEALTQPIPVAVPGGAGGLDDVLGPAAWEAW
jgi:hypothetical protein